MPEVQVKDHVDDKNTFELLNPSNPLYPIILTSRRDHIKTLWLEEIREFAVDSDFVGKLRQPEVITKNILYFVLFLLQTPLRNKHRL